MLINKHIMTTPENIKQLIIESDSNTLFKTLANRYIDGVEDMLSTRSLNRELVETVAREKHLLDILYASDEVIFYTVYGKDEWSIKYPVRSIYKNDKGNWERCATVAPTMDTAYLVYLEDKQKARGFADFALKMLDIKLED